MKRTVSGNEQIYSSPGAVCADASLTHQEKLNILRQWEYDAREREVAEEENMAGGPPDELAEVLAALRALEGQPDGEAIPTNKHGG